MKLFLTLLIASFVMFPVGSYAGSRAQAAQQLKINASATINVGTGKSYDMDYTNMQQTGVSTTNVPIPTPEGNIVDWSELNREHAILKTNVNVPKHTPGTACATQEFADEYHTVRNKDYNCGNN